MKLDIMLIVRFQPASVCGYLLLDLSNASDLAVPLDLFGFLQVLFMRIRTDHEQTSSCLEQAPMSKHSF